MFSLASFLNLDKNTQIELELPSRPSMMEIPVDEALRWGRSNNPQLLELKQNVLEAERNVDRTKKESHFNASVNASIGFNQVAENFGDVYHKPMQQDLGQSVFLFRYWTGVFVRVSIIWQEII